MKFGMMYLFSEYGSIPQSQVFKEFIEEVELAEELGFDSIWLPEHHFSVYGILGDTLTMAAAIAQRTKKIKIGTAVVLLPLNHPVRVAEQAALVDCLSDGRLLLGVGRAYQPGEFGGFGLVQAHLCRGPQAQEFVAARARLEAALLVHFVFGFLAFFVVVERAVVSAHRQAPPVRSRFIV